METDVNLISARVHEQLEYYLFRTLTSAGYCLNEATSISEFYMVLLRSSTFTKANTYRISIIANKDTGLVKLVAHGDELRNKKDVSITINQLKYRKHWWFFFTTYSICKSHC